MKMQTKQIVLSRMLPKTGSTINTRPEEDGDLQKGWWKGLSLAGNKTRFVSKTIGVDKVVIDLATGLMWAADGNEAGCYNGGDDTWYTLVSYPETINFAGFTDWRAPNVLELISIVNYGADIPAVYTDYFLNTIMGFYITSTSYQGDASACWNLFFATGVLQSSAKNITTYNLRSVRDL